ncbi:elongation factor 1-beta [Candidatus Woesearchaeota archaeon]|nr:elongation factor 1-beta [Candidatus Woesearchaeota archaeon]
MARVIVNLRVMPEDIEVNLEELTDRVIEKIINFGGETPKAETEEVAFGLKSLKILFLLDESKSNLDPLEEAVRGLEGVNSADVVDVRRAIG